MTKREERKMKREQELEKIREEIRQKELAWAKPMPINPEDCIDPHFKPLNLKSDGFTPDANHWTNLN